MDIEVRNLTYEYDSGTPQAVRAVDDVSLTIPGGQFVGIVGHTGSGKSTLVQLIDGLLKPTAGSVYLDGEDIASRKFDRKHMRSLIGIVFQYPEYQLFESTILKDVCFGPLNMGLKQEEAVNAATDALLRLGIPRESFGASPFEISGGQKRRVAIAGVLAMNPKILILDEPTAGLDPGGREEVLGLLKSLNESGLTIILVSHSMEDVAKYVDRILVMNEGKIFMDGNGKEVFSHVEQLEEIGLAAPEVAYLMKAVHDAGIPVATNITTAEEACGEILRALKN